MPQTMVSEHLSGSKVVFGFAEEQVRELDRLTIHLSDPSVTTKHKNDVWRIYLAYLVFARQVAVSINNAGKAAGYPTQFTNWWVDLKDSPTHAFFCAERNSALKDMDDTIVLRCITDGMGNRLAYWTFRQGPHAGDPLVPRCQQYNDWLYNDMRAPACELLFPWTLSERQSIC